MMPISALPSLPMPLPVLPAAPVVTDFTALLQGGEAAAPVELAEEEGQTIEAASPDVDVPAPQAAPPLPAPPAILAMLRPSVPAVPSAPEAPGELIAVAMPAVQSLPPAAPAKAMSAAKPTRGHVADEAVAREIATPAIEPAPMRAEVTHRTQPVAPRVLELPVLSAPAPTEAPASPVSPTVLEVSSASPRVEPEVITVKPAKLELPISPDKPAPSLPSGITATPASSATVEASQPQPVRHAQPVPTMVPQSAPTPLPVLAPVVPLIQPDAPRPSRAAPALPPLSASAPTAEPISLASPTMREVPSSPPPAEVQALVADAAAPEPPAAPDQPAAPLPQPQPVALAPTQPSVMPDALQPPIDTTDPRWIERMAQEIADIADGDGRTSFRLNPETLGSMEVTVRHTPDGISVRFEVESESTRTLLAHAEQRLQAEARANGVRIADAQVDLADRGQREGRDRPAEQPLIAIRTGTTADSIPPAERTPASARYA